MAAIFLNGKDRGGGKKAFLYYFAAFVLANASEGCALRRTLIKISAPGALFASCSTPGTWASQIQITGYPGQVT